MEIMKTSIRAILDNIESAQEFLDEQAIEDFEDIIINSKNIFVTGAGRSGLAAKAFAMRLMHLGLSAYVVGETISPAIYEDDCIVEGILEVLPDSYGFLRGDNYLPTPKDVYISPIQIKRFRLNTGDMVKGIARNPKEEEKFPALIFVGEVNGQSPENAYRRTTFDDLIPIYPTERLKLETTQN